MRHNRFDLNQLPPPPAEQTICGYHAVHAALQARPEHLRRLLFATEHFDDLRQLLAKLASRRVPYREVGADELERASGSRAHQGLVAVFAAPQIVPITAVELASWAGERKALIALDGVANPHNLGAIARTAAFLGAHAIVLQAGDAPAARSTAAYRTAEGALERLRIGQTPDLPAALATLRATGATVLALAADGAEPLHKVRMPKTGALVLVAGAEEAGLRPEVRAACTHVVRIEGSGLVESLNVGVALGVALAQLWRPSDGGRTALR
ncbi:MAG: RNA methyltransferase [Myxococcales bacterium]|nr:RNA methyltransferase [Myxococcales bacterium]